MKIRIEDIPEEGLSLEVAAGPEAFEKLAGKLDFTLASPEVAGFMNVTLAEGGLFVAGSFSAEIRVGCSRCLKEFVKPVGSSYTLFYERGGGGKRQGREMELKPEDMDVSVLVGDELDTDEILLGQLSLEVDMQPLCSPDCKGLCSRCGANLNDGPCGCTSGQKADPRLAGLKDFKVK